ncbi:hypothetical protein [Pyruvatibacter mobilis]|jgi:hypothetical protein|uniref:hypothetical protein n=1 Tax=Pyruvatibacter mobilis TaxID=1712261 RepID=UPI003BAF18CD
MRSSFSGACIALLALPLLATAPSLAADADQDADDGITLLGDRLPFNTELMAHLTDPQENVVGEVPFILRAKQSGEIKPLSITIGGFFNGTYLFERTDTAGKYPILSRFPNVHGSGNTNTEAVINSAGVAGLISVGDWVTGYAQAEYSETNFRGDQEDVQLREYFVVVGNLDEFPVYAAIGRKSVDFGEQFGYNPFTHTINQHFFWTLADEPVIELGYVGDDWRVSGTVANGERMLRVGMTNKRDGGLGTNFAVKAEKTFTFDEDRALRVSASYLDDTIYNSNFTAHTVQALNRFGPPNAPRPPRVLVTDNVGLWDVAAEYTTDSYDLAVEYTRSTELWPATSYDTNTGAELPGARHLSAVSAMGRYKTDLFGIATDFSAVYSKSIIGPDNTEFDELTQHVIGMEMHINKYMDIGAEVVFNGGFQPFVGIQDVSDSGVDSQVGIVGLKLRL